MRVGVCLLVFGEDLTFEGEDGAGFFPPDGGGESCFDAGLAEKLGGCPAVFASDLGEEEAASASGFDDEAVAAYFDVLPAFGRGTGEFFGRGEDGYFDCDVGEFVRSDRPEPRVTDGCGYGGVFEGFCERHDGVGDADAAAEVAELGEGDEYAAGGFKYRRVADVCDRFSLYD